jgi:hypothetical protein
MTAILLLALAAPIEVLVEPFAVPEEIHDGIKNEVKLWPRKLAEAFKEGDPVRFAEAGKAGHRLTGEVSVVADGKKLVVEVKLRQGMKLRWSEKYELTDISKKVEFLDETRMKIVSEVKKALAR